MSDAIRFLFHNIFSFVHEMSSLRYVFTGELAFSLLQIRLDIHSEQSPSDDDWLKALSPPNGSNSSFERRLRCRRIWTAINVDHHELFAYTFLIPYRHKTLYVHRVHLTIGLPMLLTMFRRVNDELFIFDLDQLEDDVGASRSSNR